MPNSIIYACGDYVKLKSLRQCNGLRNKNPIALAVGVSIPDEEVSKKLKLGNKVNCVRVHIVFHSI